LCNGPSRHFAGCNNQVAFGATADIKRQTELADPVENDPLADVVVTAADICRRGGRSYHSTCFEGSASLAEPKPTSYFASRATARAARLGQLAG
jgi:hypothetical protein